jgi:ATP-dependent RNA helicase DHX33
MAAFPVDPMYACAIVASEGYHCTLEILEIISVLSASSKLFVDITDQREAVAEQRLKFRHPSGDHLTVLNVARAYQEITAAATGEGDKNGGGSSNNNSRNKDKAAKKEWCRKHFLNERTLLEAQEIKTQLKTVCQRLNINWAASTLKKGTADEGPLTEEDAIIRSLGHGLCGNAAFLQPDGTYKQIIGQSVSATLYGEFG